MSHQNPWRTLTSRTAYENEWLRVREDSVITPAGKPGIYGVVQVGPSVGVVALNERGEIALVGQWRYPLERYGWEIIRGAVDPGEAPDHAARRELREEIGFEAGALEPLAVVDVQSGVSTDVQHLYIATGLKHVGEHHEGTEDLRTRWIPFDDAVAMCSAGEIREACSIAALLLLAQRR